MKNVLVIGAGAAGLMAAFSAADSGASVTVLEKNEKAGKKIYITGKGRCNFTNYSDISEHMSNVITNPKFMYRAYSALDAYGVYGFFEEHGLKCKVERGNRAFPASDHASDVTNTLLHACREKGVSFRFDAEVTEITPDLNVKCRSGEVYQPDSVILATGGMSYPSTGSDGAGFKFAESLGHRVTELYPGLVALHVREKYVRDLEGLSLKNTGFTLISGNKKIYSDRGELLFTKNGISGPLSLTASEYLERERRRYSRKGKNIFDSNPEVILDLKPALSKEQLDRRILRDFSSRQNKSFHNSLDSLLPSSFIPVAVKLSEIDGQKKVNSITRAEREKLVDVIKGVRLHVVSTGSFNEAVITNGGVDVKEINPGTMESKIVPGLFFAGEIIDVDALTGGFNLQVSWSTGFLAGRSAAAE